MVLGSIQEWKTRSGRVDRQPRKSWPSPGFVAASVSSEVLMSALQPTILGLAILFVTLGLATAGPPVQERPDPADEIHHDTRARMEKERRDGEWKKLKEDTEKLVQAANDLKGMIEKSNKDTFSVSIVKKTEDVEKILKEIKRRAKGGF